MGRPGAPVSLDGESLSLGPPATCLATFVGHLDRGRVPQLARGEPATDTGESGGSSELLASG